MTDRNWPGRMFIVYGMPRTGTTYLYHALGKHPQIFVSYRKESLFFSVNFDKGFDWYRAFFEDRRPGEIAADVNPMYFMDNSSLERVLAFNPNVSVVLGVREPVDFAVSLYGNIAAHGNAVPTIVETMHNYDWQLTPRNKLRICLDDRFISRRIEELCRTFGNRLLIYDFREFDRSPLPVLRAIEDFLGLRPFFDQENFDKSRINASGRRNILGLNKIVANQRVLEAAYRILPKAAIRSIRHLIESMSAANLDKPSGRSNGLSVPSPDLTALEDYFRDDRQFYNRLFSSEPILLGSDVLARR